MTHTHITMIIDRTGSMNVVRSDAEGAINAFITEQRDVEGDCDLLLVDFDDVEPFRVVHDGALELATGYELRPRGNTPLHDAVGKGIATTEERVLDSHPDVVIFVVQTDGQNNASREYTAERVKEMIDSHTDWTFVFLATGPDAWTASKAYAGTALAAHTMASTRSAKSVTSTVDYLSAQVTNSRLGNASNYAASVADDGTVTAANADDITTGQNT
jgi:hypothetical protein